MNTNQLSKTIFENTVTPVEKQSQSCHNKISKDPYSKRKQQLFVGILALLWCFASIVSVLHIINRDWLSFVPNELAGYLGWSAFILTILYLARKRIIFLLFVFCAFFLFGYITGSFLEPPGDTLDHLTNSYERCDTNISEVERTNHGLWQYGMNSIFLCSDQKSEDPQKYLFRVDLLHGVYCGIGAVVLVILALQAGFSRKLAVLSACIAFLFFGTNVFSYFRYYSYAPSFTSLILFWIWITFYFFNKFTLKNYLYSALAVLCFAPILVVNHIQEAVFLLFLFIFFTIIHITWMVWKKNEGVKPKGKKCWKTLIYNRKTIYIIILFILLFILPQYSFFRDFLSDFFLYNYWENNQDALYKFDGLHISGRIFDYRYRILDTLGIIGFLPLLLLPVILIKNETIQGKKNRGRIFILGLLPLLVYCIPLFNYIWLSNCIRTPTHLRYYYRMCYIGLAWLPCIYFINTMGVLIWESKVSGFLKFVKKRVFKIVFYGVFFLAIVGLSTKRTFPFYGKTDFLFLNSRPWWPAWNDIVSTALKKESKDILTDPVTGIVLSGVFGRNIKNSYKITGHTIIVEKIENYLERQDRSLVPGAWVLLLENLNIEYLNSLDNALIEWREREKEGTICIVNTRGFDSSWVGVETGHWSVRMADTKWFYRYHYTHVKDLKKELKDYPPVRCNVFF